MRSRGATALKGIVGALWWWTIGKLLSHLGLLFSSLPEMPTNEHCAAKAEMPHCKKKLGISFHCTKTQVQSLKMNLVLLLTDEVLCVEI